MVGGCRRGSRRFGFVGGLWGLWPHSSAGRRLKRGRGVVQESEISVVEVLMMDHHCQARFGIQRPTTGTDPEKLLRTCMRIAEPHVRKDAINCIGTLVCTQGTALP